MAKFVPSFNVASKAKTAFSTNNPLGEDRTSTAVQINNLTYNETTRSIEVNCSDRRVRQCRIDRFNDDKQIKELTKKLQQAFDSRALVKFVAAGANDPNVWFYNIITANA